MRDPSSALILSALVELGKKLRKRTAGSQALPENEVKVALQKEFEELLKNGQLNDIINSLLGMDGEFFYLPYVSCLA